MGTTIIFVFGLMVWILSTSGTVAALVFWRRSTDWSADGGRERRTEYLIDQNRSPRMRPGGADGYGGTHRADRDERSHLTIVSNREAV